MVHLDVEQKRERKKTKIESLPMCLGLFYNISTYMIEHPERQINKNVFHTQTTSGIRS